MSQDQPEAGFVGRIPESQKDFMAALRAYNEMNPRIVGVSERNPNGSQRSAFTKAQMKVAERIAVMCEVNRKKGRGFTYYGNVRHIMYERGHTMPEFSSDSFTEAMKVFGKLGVLLSRVDRLGAVKGSKVHIWGMIPDAFDEALTALAEQKQRIAEERDRPRFDPLLPPGYVTITNPENEELVTRKTSNTNPVTPITNPDSPITNPETPGSCNPENQDTVVESLAEIEVEINTLSAVGSPADAVDDEGESDASVLDGIVDDEDEPDTSDAEQLIELWTFKAASESPVRMLTPTSHNQQLVHAQAILQQMPLYDAWSVIDSVFLRGELDNRCNMKWAAENWGKYCQWVARKSRGEIRRDTDDRMLNRLRRKEGADAAQFDAGSSQAAFDGKGAVQLVPQPTVYPPAIRPGNLDEPKARIEKLCGQKLSGTVAVEVRALLAAGNLTDEEIIVELGLSNDPPAAES